MSQSVRKDVPSGNFHRLFEKIMFENNESGIDNGHVSENVFPVLEDLLDGSKATMDIKVIGIKSSKRTDASPHDRCEAHSQRDCPDTIIDVTVRWAHHVGGNTEDVLDNFLRPSKFSNDFLVSQSCQGGVTPSMYCDLVLAHILGLKCGREGNYSGADDEEGRLEAVCIQELQQVGCIVGRAVIISQPPFIFSWTFCDVSGPNTSTTSPPAACLIGSRCRVIWASSWIGGVQVRDFDTCCIDLSNPLLDFWRRDIRKLIQRGIRRRSQKSSVWQRRRAW